ncbi:MAG: class A beta-lactamase [Caulobacter sp.]
MHRALALIAVLTLAACGPASPGVQPMSPPLDAAILDQEIGEIAARAQPASMEIAVQNLDGGEMWAWNGDKAFPMQSVFKAPLAATVLSEVDHGRLSLDETITIEEPDISPAHSPVADAWPRVTTYTVRDLLERTVSDSDNTAADVLMRRIGGPGAVTAWLRGQGVKDIRIDRYERELQPNLYGMASFRIAWKGWPAFEAARNAVAEPVRRAATARYLADPRDTMTASGGLTFLRRLSLGQLISPPSTALLLKLMGDTRYGTSRLAAGLPPDARLVHKSGASATDLGLTPAVNDIGIVTLKDGRKYAVIVFLSATPRDERAQQEIFADVMRVIVKAAG